MRRFAAIPAVPIYGHRFGYRTAAKRPTGTDAGIKKPAPDCPMRALGFGRYRIMLMPTAAMSAAAAYMSHGARSIARARYPPANMSNATVNVKPMPTAT